MPEQGKTRAKRKRRCENIILCVDHSSPCYIGQGVIDTGCSRFWIGQKALKNGNGCSRKSGVLNTQKIKLEGAMTLRFGNDETLETRTMAILPVGTAGVNGVLRVHVVPGRTPLWLSKEFLKDLVDICSLRSWECEQW